MSTLASELPADPTQCVVLQGNSIQGGMLWGQTSPSAEIRFGDRRVPVLPDGQFLLGLGRDMPASVELVIKGEATTVAKLWWWLAVTTACNGLRVFPSKR